MAVKNGLFIQYPDIHNTESPLPIIHHFRAFLTLSRGTLPNSTFARNISYETNANPS